MLNDRPCKISEESRRRIKEVARRKRYIPNQIARSLVTRRSQTVGLVVPNIESRFFSSLARRLELGCRERGYVLLITNSDESAENDAELVQLLANRGVWTASLWWRPRGTRGAPVWRRRSTRCPCPA